MTDCPRRLPQLLRDRRGILDPHADHDRVPRSVVGSGLCNQEVLSARHLGNDTSSEPQPTSSVAIPDDGHLEHLRNRP